MGLTSLSSGLEAKVKLRLLSAGSLFLPMNLFCEGSDASDIRKVPSMSWLIEHERSGQKIIFDLGVRRDIHNYTPAIYHRVQMVIKTEVEKDVVESLRQIGLDPSSDITSVIFSHLHWDHTGDPCAFEPNTKFIIGNGAKNLICGPKSYPSDPKGHFDSTLLPEDRIVELPPAEDRNYWSVLGNFSAAHDYFGDGSVYIINAPGHCPGHVNLLAHVSEDKWMLLAGDSTHSPSILEEVDRTAVYMDQDTGLLKCAHHDKEQAEEHLQRLRAFRDTYKEIEIVLAHDPSRYEELRERFK